ncbi:MAG: hypothetical protein IKB58_04695, partial [Oscillospiraceae bacterium]|nr:hypothetical protein [Oscillospiraceae bacterium]
MTEYVTLTSTIPEEELLPPSAPVDPDSVTPVSDAAPVTPPEDEGVPDAPDAEPEAVPEEDP